MKLNEISLYDLHKDPESLYGYDKADMEIPAFFWGKYRADPKELKKREDAIAKSAKYSYLYTRDILKGRWPEGEKAIAKDPWYAYAYAMDVIKGRWPEGEKAIAKDPQYAYFYARNILKNRWPEREDVIADSKWAYPYAVHVMRGRFPAGEKAIAREPDRKEGYERRFGIKI